MRRFTAAYLADTRAGLWEDRTALTGLDLPNRERILEVGAGTGEFSRVLEEESNATLTTLDVDRGLLTNIDGTRRVVGDATSLPFTRDSFDLVVCQALLVNLPDPIVAIEEFGRVSDDLVAAIEPDNAAVDVSSTVPGEAQLAARAREYYMDGLQTDAGIGSRVDGLFESAGVSVTSVSEHPYERRIDPPYSEKALTGAKRKVAGSRLRDHRSTMLRGSISQETFDDLLEDWQSMGRKIAKQIGDETYHRSATVPFYVTVGNASD